MKNLFFNLALINNFHDIYNLIKLQNNFLAVYSKKDNIKINTNQVEDLNQQDLEILDKVLKQNNIDKITINNEDQNLDQEIVVPKDTEIQVHYKTKLSAGANFIKDIKT